MLNLVVTITGQILFYTSFPLRSAVSVFLTVHPTAWSGPPRAYIPVAGREKARKCGWSRVRREEEDDRGVGPRAQPSCRPLLVLILF